MMSDQAPIPTVFLSHGAPMIADDPVWKDDLSRLGSTLGRPESILIVSAHWENAPLTIGATRTVPLVYDFWGFPEKYYHVQYPAPGAPELAEQTRSLLADQAVHDEPMRGLDHGAYVPLVEMYPEADIPVLQVSMPTLDPAELFEVGRRLSPLRDQGVLIVGSGFTTHNLRQADRSGGVPSWSSEFDDWMKRAVATNSVDELIDFRTKAPASHTAHPTTEHFAPLFVALGAAADDGPDHETVIDGYWFGLSKRSVRFN